uniref:Probable cb-type cytochrome c oxidase subunit III n=1 Tax=Chlorobium chlorochromatii (strain CaD3) TaxID=340177 RepID=Q3AQV7_CHLCH
MHDNDIPHEGHNKIPIGWLLFFAGTIIFLVGYIALYTPAISGWSYYKGFEKEMAEAAKAQKSATVKSYAGNQAAINEGKELFASSCAACHNADATGGIGPNLTTATLKYGATEKELYTSIADGRPNGMPPFGQQLGADNTSKIIAFLETLRK